MLFRLLLLISSSFLEQIDAVCDAPVPGFLGDGYCDRGLYNTPGCNWDGGDCCAETCVEAEYACGSNGFNCTNPGINSAAPTPIPPTTSPTGSSCIVPNVAFIGDGYCDRGVYNTEDCNWDGGDCCPDTCYSSVNECGSNGYACHTDTKSPTLSPTSVPTSRCNATNLFWIGDGFCDKDPEYNNDRCDWDGGDCCQQTCRDSINSCGVVGYECRDPDVTPYPTLFPTEAPSHPTNSPSAFPTLIPPTSAPTNRNPTLSPTSRPTTRFPTRAPSRPTVTPTRQPTSLCADGCAGPGIESASFDGSYTSLLIRFSAPTDRGSSKITNFDKSFSCSQLFSFPGSQGSSCNWQNADVVYARLGTVALESLSIGDDITLLGGVLRLQCSSADLCESYQYSVAESKSLISTEAGISPVISLTSSGRKLSLCNDIVLTPLVFRGNYGRNWKQVQWEVTGSGGNITEIIKLLNQITDLSTPIVIPSTLTALGDLSFTLTVLNFLNLQGVASVSVTVSSDVLNNLFILEGSSMKLRVSSRLSLTAFSRIPPCLRLQSVPLSYSWKVFDRNGALVPSIVSTSNSQASFIAPSHTFGLAWYVIQVESLSAYSTDTSIASINISVFSTGTEAKIAGGNRTVSALSPWTVDASSSFHRDYSSAILSYSWECELDNGNACGLSLESGPTLSFPANVVPGLSSTRNFIFTVHVTSNIDSFESSTSVKISLSPLAVPVILMDLTNPEYESSASLTFGATVRTIGSGFNAAWTVFPSVGANNLTSYTLIGAANRDTFVPMTFAPKAFIDGQSYTISLRVSTLQGSLTSSSLFRIYIHKTPYGGKLTVAPTSGQAVTTEFVLSTNLWIVQDDSLPLKYTMYSYSASDSDLVTIASPSISSIARVRLGPGVESMNFKVSCRVVAEDTFGSISSPADSFTTVQPLFNSSLLLSLLSGFYTEASDSFDSLLSMQLSSSAASLLNQANCSIAPDCDSLNRQQCSSVSQTCGPCKSGYIGIDGHSNQECIEEANARRLSSRILANCISGEAGCQKSCPNDCSSNGVCVATDFNDNLLESCSISDIYCRVSCSCNSGFYGRSCDMDSEQHSAALATREMLCANFYQSTKLEDLTDSVIFSRTVVTSLILFDSTQISYYALTNCTTVIVNTVDTVGTSAIKLLLPLIVRSLSQVLASKAIIDPVLLNQTLSTVNKCMDAYVAESSSDSSAVNIISDNIRLTSATFGGLQSGANVLEIPRTAFEALLDSKRPQISLNSNPGDAGIVGLTLIQFINNPNNELSNSSEVQIQTVSNSSNSELNFTIAMKNVLPFTYHKANDESLEVECELSEDLLSYYVAVNCSGSIFSVLCPGNITAVAYYTCPDYSEEPTCRSRSTGSGTVICEVVGYDGDETLCSCKRVVGVSLGSLNNHRASTIQTVGTGLQVIQQNFAARWISISRLSADDVLQNPVISAITITLILLLVFGIVYFLYKDLRRIVKRTDERYINTGGKDYTIKEFFKRVIPPQFSKSPWPIRFAQILSQKHSLFALFCHVHEDEYRTCQWIEFIGKTINFVFVGTLLAAFFFPDDGTCERKKSESACLKMKSIDFKTNVCHWDSQYEFCEYQAPDSSFTTGVIMALAINICCVPLDAIVLYAMAQYRAFFTYHSEVYFRKVEDEKNPREVVELGEGEAIKKNRKRKEYQPTPNEFAELRKIQTRKANLIRAARLYRMEAIMDKLDVNAEVAVMLHADDATNSTEAIELLADYVAPTKKDITSVVVRKVAVSKHLVRQTVTGKNAFDGRRTLIKSAQPQQGISRQESGFSDQSNGATSKLQDESYQQLLRRNVKLARTRAAKIERRMKILFAEDKREIYLFRKFLVDAMIGIRRIIANQFFFGHFNDEFAFAEKSLLYIKLWVWLFPLFPIALCIYVFLFGISIGSRATNAWLLFVFSSLIQEVILLESCYLYLMNIVLVSIVYKDLLLVTTRIRKRTRAIMNRIFGQMMGIKKSYMQHLNAGCRAARQFPELPAARLLISLNDSDMPRAFMPRYHKSSGSLHALITCGEAIKNFALLLYLWLPEAAQGALIETMVNLMLNFLFLAIYVGSVLNGVSASVAGVFVTILLLLVLSIPFTKSIRDKVVRACCRQHRYADKYGSRADEKDVEMNGGRQPSSSNNNIDNSDLDDEEFMRRKIDDIDYDFDEDEDEYYEDEDYEDTHLRKRSFFSNSGSM